MSELVTLDNQTFKLLFDVQYFDKMFSTKVFSEIPSVELIEGEILARGEIVQNGFRDSERIASLLIALLKQEAQIKIQPLIYLNKFLLMKPSIAVIKNSVDFENEKFIQAENVLFVIEMTDSRYNYSDNQRARKYGLANLPEVWFVISNLGFVEVCTKPNYGYSQYRTYRRGDLIKSETIPHLEIEVNKILGE